MVLPDDVSNTILFVDVKASDGHVDVGKQFTNKHEFSIREHML